MKGPPSAPPKPPPGDEFAERRARAELRLAAAQATRPPALEHVHTVVLRPPPPLPKRVFRNGVFMLPARRGPGRPRKLPNPEEDF